mmetsp:Transcript_28753/g.53924  ORF Transcript_28753/g.53924 Transcript_28753/m.53924 type:complete len:309 (-) Transcript_28753:640-1566(-)
MAQAALDEVGHVAHPLRHDRIADHDGQAAVLGGSHGPELEAVPAEGEGCRPVAVLHIGLDGHRLGAARRLLLLLRSVGHELPPLDDLLHVLLEALARVQGDDGRRCLLGAEAVVVPRGGHGAADQLVVLGQAVGEAGDACDEEEGTLLGLPRVEEVQAGVRAHRPVRVLPAAVDARKGLLMEEDLETELRSLPVHDLHEQHVAVAGHIGRTEDWRHFVLPWRHLVVLHGHRAAHLDHRRLDAVEEQLHVARNGLEVVQVTLLMTGRQLPKERAPCVHEVRPGLVMLGLNHEELLLPAQVAVDGLSVLS